MEYVSHVCDSSLSANSVVNATTPGYIYFTYNVAGSGISAETEIMDITFKVKEGATEGSFSQIVTDSNSEFTFSYPESSSGIDYVEVDMNIITGGVTVKAGPVAVSSVTVNSDSNEVDCGSSLIMTAEVLPSNADNKSVDWSVDDATKASIDSTGVLKALKAGTVTVKATAKDGSGVYGTKEITINALEASVSLTIGSAKVVRGHQITIPVILTSGADAGALQAYIKYDSSVLTVIDVEDPDEEGGFANFYADFSIDGIISLVIDGEHVDNEVSVANITFEVDENADAGATSVYFYEDEAEPIAFKTVAHGDMVTPPDINLLTLDENTYFAGWSNELYQPITQPTNIYPVIAYVEDAEYPDYGLESGVYVGSQEFSLDLESETADVRYSITYEDETKDVSNAPYLAPFNITENCIVSVIVREENKNDTELTFEYVILENDAPETAPTVNAPIVDNSSIMLS